MAVVTASTWPSGCKQPTTTPSAPSRLQAAMSSSITCISKVSCHKAACIGNCTPTDIGAKWHAVTSLCGTYADFLFNVHKITTSRPDQHHEPCPAVAAAYRIANLFDQAVRGGDSTFYKVCTQLYTVSSRFGSHTSPSDTVCAYFDSCCSHFLVPGGELYTYN